MVKVLNLKSNNFKRSKTNYKKGRTDKGNSAKSNLTKNPSRIVNNFTSSDRKKAFPRNRLTESAKTNDGRNIFSKFNSF